MIALAGLLLSSCTMRAVVGVDVNPDGSGVFDLTVAFDEELRTLLEEDSPEPIDWTDPSSFEGTDSPADFLDELPEGATTEPYTEDDFEGFTVTAEFSSLEELEQILADASSEDEEAFPLSIVSDGERFELTTDGDLFGDTQLAEEETEFIPESMLADLFDFQLEVQLPGDIVSTNADETTDDGVMVWRLDMTSEDPVEPAAISEIGSSFPWVIVLVAALVLAAVVAAGLLLMRNRPEPAAPAPDPEPEATPEA